MVANVVTDSCLWMDVIVPCVKFDSTGEISEASTETAIAYLDVSSTLANGAIFVENTIISNLQPHRVGEVHSVDTSEPAAGARRVAGNHDQKMPNPQRQATSSRNAMNMS
jgi:hypothetical protein